MSSREVITLAGGSDYSLQESKEKHQLSILTQLLRVMPTMRDMDEVLRWLASAITQRLDVQLIQFWTLHINQISQRAVQLRAMTAQDPSLPERAVVNDQIMRTVALISSEPSPPLPQSVEQIFPYYQASLLKRCGLNYCTYCSLDNSVAASGLKNSHSYESAVPHLITTAFLFLRQPTRADPVPTIRAILEQALVMAEGRGILAPHQAPPPRQPVPPRPEPQQEVLQPSLADLIPHRKQDPDLLMSSNPFASPIAITDKQARRLHTVIDGHKNVAELCASIGMDQQEALAALQLLLAQHRIELYEPGGRLVKAAHLSKYR
jgi:hypothetical protein